MKQVHFSPIMDVFSFFENDKDNVKMTNTRVVQKQTRTEDNRRPNCKILKEKLRKFRLASLVVRICNDFAPPLVVP